ncbi:MAG: pyruvate kinase [Ancalomicrobiaceae bacterium]|nr:pyruvate kinase [Ancalomicrobiaceae bacterium]
MRRNRRVKILATLGPASGDAEMIEKLYRAGADVFRINMSHTNHQRLAELVALIRGVEAKVERPIAILADLQGPKLRVGTFADGPAELEIGQTFTLDDNTAPGDSHRVHLPHPEILESVQPGHRLLLDDGKIRLRCTSKPEPRTIVTEVEVAGRLSDRKGVSLPDTELPIGALTEKDRLDLVAALAQSVDWIALSFVQRPEDIDEVRAVAGTSVGILAKIEKPQAIDRLPEIIARADALMVARGDLGVEMPPERVPGLQKQMIRLCRRVGKPVVVATQMLESMIVAPVPTRAEVSDVSTAVFEGADAVMLSAESAAGKFPVEAVAMMNSIAEEVERDSDYPSLIQRYRADIEPTSGGAIAAAARQITETLNLAAIVCFTKGGTTGRRVARERPMSQLIGLSPDVTMARRMCLLWGMHPVVISEDAHDVDDMVEKATKVAREEGFATEGQKIIISAGVPFGFTGTTNMLRIAQIPAPGKSE